MLEAALVTPFSQDTYYYYYYYYYYRKRKLHRDRSPPTTA